MEWENIKPGSHCGLQSPAVCRFFGLFTRPAPSCALRCCFHPTDRSSWVVPLTSGVPNDRVTLIATVAVGYSSEKSGVIIVFSVYGHGIAVRSTITTVSYWKAYATHYTVHYYTTSTSIPLRLVGTTSILFVKHGIMGEICHEPTSAEAYRGLYVLLAWP